MLYTMLQSRETERIFVCVGIFSKYIFFLSPAARIVKVRPKAIQC